ncbi:triphosphate pyrophosphohydrolase mazG-like domain protein [Caudoviricetes sp.]|nr:triphosphate pyrophosphohydrolase mazG-like domain protein [Caudoviricetes sp.]
MIDIEKEREWWTLHGDEVSQYVFGVNEMADEYLDELEAAHKIRVELEAECSELSAELTQLRAQLADQRARDIRMMTFVSAWFTSYFSDEGLVAICAKGHDRLAEIPVPPAKEDTGNQTLRPVVSWFAEEMEKRLTKNDHKPGWDSDSFEALFKRLNDEALELEMAYYGGSPDDEFIQEAADIANFAMMIADNASKKEGTK